MNGRYPRPRHPRSDHQLRRAGRRQCSDLRFSPGHADRDRRSQRRRQDDLLQSDLRAAAAVERRASACSAPTSPGSARRSAPAAGSAARSSSPISTPTSVFSRTCASRCSPSPRSGSIFSASPRATRGSARRRVRWLDRVKLTPRAALPAAALSHGDQRKLEVAILLALKPRVFMFDEPTAGMSLDEVPVILDLIDEIKLEGDKTVLLVEHRMDVIKRLADRIVVLQDGAMIADGPPAEVVALPAVQQAYLGMQRAQSRSARPAMADAGEALLRLDGVYTDIGRYQILYGVDLTVRRGAGHDAARTQRRRQDDDAAHHHGSVEGACRGDHLRWTVDRRHGDARHRAPGHRLRAGEHGHLRQADGAREHAARHRLARVRQGPSRPRARVLPGAEVEMGGGGGLAVRRAEADAGDRTRHRRAAAAVAGGRADQGLVAGDGRSAGRSAAAN